MRWYYIGTDYTHRPAFVQAEVADPTILEEDAPFESLRAEDCRVLYTRDELEADPFLRLLLQAWEGRDDRHMAHCRALEAAWTGGRDLQDAEAELRAYTFSLIEEHAASDEACAEVVEAVSLTRRALSLLEPVIEEAGLAAKSRSEHEEADQPA